MSDKSFTSYRKMTDDVVDQSLHHVIRTGSRLSGSRLRSFTLRAPVIVQQNAGLTGTVAERPRPQNRSRGKDKMAATQRMDKLLHHVT